MAGIPTVVVHHKELQIGEHLRASIKKRCAHIALEFHEVRHFEFALAPDGVGVMVHGHATGKNTDLATHAEGSDAGIACDRVLDKIERQLRRIHDKRIFTRRRDARRDPPKRKALA